MLPPKVRFPCSLLSLSSSRTRGTGSLSLWATRARSATCPCVWKEQRCLPTCSTCIALRPLSLVPASALLVFVLFASPVDFRRFFPSFFFAFHLTRVREVVFALSLVFGGGGQCVGGVNFCPSWLVGRSVGWPGSGTVWVNSLETRF